MKRKRKIWRYSFLSLLIPFACLLILQHAQASISAQVLNSFSNEIQEWENKGYELDEAVITDLKWSEECIISILSPIETDIFLGRQLNYFYKPYCGILKIYVVQENGIIPFFEKKFDYRLYDLEVRDINNNSNNEIILEWSTGGNSALVNGIAIFEIRDDCVVPIKLVPPVVGRLINYDDPVIYWEEGFIPTAYLVSLDGDRVCELLVLDTTFENVYGEPRAWRIFSWENNSYQEDCSSFPFFYEKEIDELKKELELEPPSPSSWVWADYCLKKPISLYLNYYYKGEAEKGFGELAKLILNEEFMKSWETTRKEQEELESLSDIMESLLSKYPL